jgi:hypothetical protein
MANDDGGVFDNFLAEGESLLGSWDALDYRTGNQSDCQNAEPTATVGVTSNRLLFRQRSGEFEDLPLERVGTLSTGTESYSINPSEYVQGLVVSGISLVLLITLPNLFQHSLSNIGSIVVFSGYTLEQLAWRGSIAGLVLGILGGRLLAKYRGRTPKSGVAFEVRAEIIDSGGDDDDRRYVYIYFDHDVAAEVVRTIRQEMTSH